MCAKYNTSVIVGLNVKKILEMIVEYHKIRAKNTKSIQILYDWLTVVFGTC